ncbi:glycolipid transfer protein 2-like [Triticum aestivum]|uniref:glycolipid transfer protein 2-like n=1 Tax=Triticum aestivum TaxID=4565 RepID=UPI001D018073|nr:glycolipid transfer protein 2-like [Triticum aestivum]
MEAEIERMKMHKGKSELRMDMHGGQEELYFVSSGDGDDQEQEWYKIRSSTMDLLCVSKHFLHVLDVIRPTLLVLSQDIEQNVQRVSLCRDYKYLHATDSLKYASLTVMVTKEVVEGTSKKTNSCARAIIWLTRSLNFSIHLLEGLVKNSESSLQEMVEEAYKSTLKPFHGWISSAAYKV